MACAVGGPGATSADGAVLRRCAPKSPLLCGRVSVPIDRAGAVPGRVSLAVRVLPAPRRPVGTLLFLAGGPGQPAIPTIPQLADPRLSPLAKVLVNRNLLVFDQRGTGASGLLRCPLLEISERFDIGPEAYDCARRLGPRRDYYQTRDSAEDIEAVRAALGLPRLSIMGVSYGTKVALAYARRYANRVERLVLDSVVGPDGDPFSRVTMNAIPRVLRDLCKGACRAINPDPVSDLVALVGTLRGGPLLGWVVGPDGRRHGTRLERLTLLNLVVAGDLGPPTLSAELPAALRSARQGDLAPILRLSRIALAVSETTEPRVLSSALNFATLCSEAPLPWSPTTPVSERQAEARSLANATGDAAFWPFDAPTAYDVSTIGCVTWPSPARPRADESGPLPAVPALLLNGVDDLRTPLEGARSTAATLPRARLVPIAATGHSTFGTDISGCAGRVLQRFFSGQPLGACNRGRRQLNATPIAPKSLDDVRTAPGIPGRTGKTMCAVASTIADARLHGLDPVFTEAFSRVRHARWPALRSGAMAIRLSANRLFAYLDHYSYVPGVAVTGRRVISGGLLRVTGPEAVPGTLQVSSRGIATGRLGGKRVRASLRPCLQRQLGLILFGPERRPPIRTLAVTPLGR
jgi:pimeloyl-ACP methyl ester carboxylesterase